MTTTTASLSHRRLSISSAFQFAGRVAGLILGILVAAVLSRSLGSAGFGDFSTALALLTIALALVDSGMSQVAIREMAARPAERGEIAAAFVVFRLAGSMILVPVGAYAAIALLGRGPAGWAGLIVVATLPLSAITGLQNVGFARLRAEVPIALMLGQSSVWLGLCAAVAYWGGGIEWFAIAFAATALANALATFLVIKHLVVLDFSRLRVHVPRLVRFALPLALAGAMVTVYYRVDAILLRGLAGPTETGLYAAAYRFLDAAQALPATVFSVGLPLLSALQRGADRERYQRTGSFLLSLALLVSLPVSAAGLVFGQQIVDLVYGAGFAAAGPVIGVVLLAFPCICLAWVLMSILLADGVLWPYVAIAAGVAILSVGSGLLFMPPYGAMAAAWITVGTEVLTVVCVSELVRRRAGVTLPARRAAGALVAALAMVGVAYFLSPVQWLFALGASLLVYALIALALGVVSQDELRTLLSRDKTLHA